MPDDSSAGPATPDTVVRPPVLVVRLLLAVAVVAVTTAIVAGGVPGWEERLFELGNRIDDSWEPVLWVPMQMGSLFGPFIVAVVAWMAWRRWRPAVGAVAVGLAASWSATVVKVAVDRARPPDLLDDVVRRVGTPLDGLGFPSGHSAVAFALAALLSPYLSRPLRWTAYGVAAVVALARVHVAAHFPLDTVGGAALGIAVGLLYHLAVGIPADVPGGGPATSRRPAPPGP